LERGKKIQVERNVLLESQVSPKIHLDLCGNFNHCWGFMNHSGHLPEEFGITSGLSHNYASGIFSPFSMFTLRILTILAI